MRKLHSVVRFTTVATISCLLLCGLAAVAETGATLSKKELKTLLATAQTPAGPPEDRSVLP